MIKKVKVIENHTNETLFKTDLENMSQAYEYAAKMEEMGIEVRIEAPTITDSLADSLGLKLEDRSKLNESLHDEIHDHEGSCCAKEVSSKH